MSAPIQIVDEDDRPIGQATKQEAWDKGLTHRCVRLVILNQAGQMLLQHRTPTKVPFPSCWDTAAAGHVDAGEDYDTAMRREISEELGFDGLQPTLLGKYHNNQTFDGRILNQFNQCYAAIDERTPTQFEEDDIDGWQWFDMAEVKKMMAEHPDQVTVGLSQIVERYY
jgi:16S rRNA (adenine1518-N6/adenine1519-N6)-dimethyltransferase